MTNLPDWDTIEAVKRAHAITEVIPLVLFLLVALLEGIAHLWSKRNRLFNGLAIAAFMLAVIGEIVDLQYGHRLADLMDMRHNAELQEITKLRKEQPMILKGAATINFGTLVDGGCSQDQKFDLIGSSPGDGPNVGWPKLPRGLYGEAHVPEVNKISVRLCNSSGAPVTYNSVPVTAMIVKK